MKSYPININKKKFYRKRFMLTKFLQQILWNKWKVGKIFKDFYLIKNSIQLSRIIHINITMIAFILFLKKMNLNDQIPQKRILYKIFYKKLLCSHVIVYIRYYDSLILFEFRLCYRKPG